jgi:hypothetical protein
MPIIRWVYPHGSVGVWATRKIAPALSGGITGGVNAPGLLFASHAFEIGRIGGIRLLRTQSASDIVHGAEPVWCASYRIGGSNRHWP